MMPEIRPDFPSNSHRKPSDKPEREVKKIIEGTAVAKKKSLKSKIAETFTPPDLEDVGLYVLFDVLIPAAKKMLQDSVVEGSQKLLWGEVRRTTSANGGRPFTSYDRISTGSSRPRETSSPRGSSHDFEGIIFDRRGEAELLLENLLEVIDAYGSVSVADLYGFAGMSRDYPDRKFGWTNLSTASVSSSRDGYLLNLPKPKPLD